MPDVRSDTTLEGKGLDSLSDTPTEIPRRYREGELLLCIPAETVGVILL
jgi:hypothetical protein